MTARALIFPRGSAGNVLNDEWAILPALGLHFVESVTRYRSHASVNDQREAISGSDASGSMYCSTISPAVGRGSGSGSSSRTFPASGLRLCPCCTAGARTASREQTAERSRQLEDLPPALLFPFLVQEDVLRCESDGTSTDHDTGWD